MGTVTFSRFASFITRYRRCEDWLDLSQVTESDERLLIEAAQKDPSRFAELYEQNFHRVYAYVARRVRDRAEIQDLTAHVFHQALANIGKFKWKGLPFAAWLYRIASNAIADQARRQVREPSEPPNASSESSTTMDLEEVERRARGLRKGIWLFTRLTHFPLGLIGNRVGSDPVEPGGER